MGQKKFTLGADIGTANQEAVGAILIKTVGVNSMLITDGGFRLKTTMEGETADELNRSLLSTLRRAEKMTTLQAEWTYDNRTERFVDFVPQGTREK